jgi:tetratricopeptide (TPR) repeat protein
MVRFAHGEALLLAQGTEPQQALELLDEAMRVAKGRAAAKVEPLRSANRARALALLGRRQEAEQAIDRAVRVRLPAAMFANMRLNVGMALLAMDQPEKAIEHFRAAHEADRGGKSGALAWRQLELHGVADQ